MESWAASTEGTPKEKVVLTGSEAPLESVMVTPFRMGSSGAMQFLMESSWATQFLMPSQMAMRLQRASATPT
jgi:hypothetical protein